MNLKSSRIQPGQAPHAIRQVQLSLLKNKMKETKRGAVPQSRIPKSAPMPTGEEVEEIVLVPCQICGRNFAQERVHHHLKVCKTPKKRKVFDPAEHRTRGTAFAPFVKLAQKTKPTALEVKPRSTWKAKSEELRGALLSARGKQPGVPMATTSNGSNDCYLVPCPHCDRRFNAKAAERHIPICTSIVNRPKTLQRGAGRKAHQRTAAPK